MTHYAATPCARCGQRNEDLVPVLDTEEGPLCEDCLNTSPDLSECIYCGRFTRERIEQEAVCRDLDCRDRDEEAWRHASDDRDCRTDFVRQNIERRIE